MLPIITFAGSERPAARPAARPTQPPAATFPLNNQPTPMAYTAPSYDALVDSPIVLGQFQRADLTVKNLPIHPPAPAGSAGASPSQPATQPAQPLSLSLVVQGDPLAPAEWKKLAGAVEKIAKAEVGIMQDAPASYLFILRLSDKTEEAGGLEHANSSVIAMPKKTLLESASGAYTIARMFFHQWNGKRIRPDYFNNINYATVPDRPHLWFFQGVTHYFAYVTLLRSGLWSPQDFWSQLASTKQTSVAIHQRGVHLGLLLDVRLRELTNNQKSLDGFMRHMNENFGKKNQPYPANGILEQLNAFTGGTNPFNEFYDRYVVKEEDLPMEDVLAFAGLKLDEITLNRSDFSVKVASGLNGHVRVTNVISESPEAKAGLQVDDLILMVDAKNVTKNLKAAQDALKGKKAGDKFTLQVRRLDENDKAVNLVLPGTFEEGEVIIANLVELPAPTLDEQKQNPTLKPQRERHAVIRQGVLLGKNDAAPMVQPAFTIASVTPNNPTVKQDNMLQLQVKITRNYDYQGEITVMLNGLPANVTAEPVTLKASETDATLTLKAAANAAVANTQNVTVAATTMLGAQPFTQTSAAMTLAVQAK
jgi:predicted metalloprotease with PDZ domain